MLHNELRVFACAAAISLLAIAGCGDDDTSGDPDATAPTPDAQQDPPDAAPACAADELLWPMTIREGSASGPALAGVHACVLDRADIPCVDTADDGMWRACLPADSDVAFTFEKDGYLAGIYAIHTPAETPASLHGRWKNIIMFADEPTSDHWEDVLGQTYPPTDQGWLWINSWQHEPDAAMWPAAMGSVSGAFDPPAAVGPMYQDFAGAHDPDATATNAVFPNIWAVLDPDPDQTVTLSHPTYTTCAPLDGGWAGDADNEVRLPIRAGFRTYIATTCY